jgi:hypothetical protein
VISFLFNSKTDCSALKLNSEDGFPHSEICGSKVAHTSPQLIAACHVLHRLCMPRHPPIALTSRLRIHTTIDRPVLLAGCDYRWFGLFGTIMVEDMIEPTQLDNHCCFNTYERIASTLARTAALFIHAVTASISRTHSQCQRGASRPIPPANRRISDLHLWKCLDRHYVADATVVVEPIGIEPMTSSLQS